MVYIHDFGTMTHCPEIGNFSSKTPKIAIFLVLLHVAILCTISLAIVLYSWVHLHQISSFICCHEDTSAEHLTRISILKNMVLRNAAAVLK